MAIQSISVPPGLAYVLNSAGEKSGVDFDYLLKTAVRESALDPEARAKTSSAVGLFQFLEATWLDVMKSDGGRLGYQNYADAIQQSDKGQYFVADPTLRKEILALREEPQIAADMAAAFTRRNGDYLTEQFGRMPSAGELYIAHFLGAGGAQRMFEAGLENPEQIAADLFPKQADANRAIFYSEGKPRTIRQVYHALVAKHSAAPTNATEFATQQISGSNTGPPVSTEQLDISFRSLFSSGNGVQKRSPVSPVGGQGNSAFFVQLYNK